MDGIVSSLTSANPNALPRPPIGAVWREGAHGWLDRIAEHMHARGAHAARTVVLLPYAQLMPLAAREWAQRRPDGFAPRFETTQNWCRSLGGFTPAATDITFDVALDVLTARAMLERTRLGAQVDAATPLLLEAAHQLGALAAAVPPAERPAWGVRARSAAAAAITVSAFQGWPSKAASVWRARAGVAATPPANRPVAKPAILPSPCLARSSSLS